MVSNGGVGGDVETLPLLSSLSPNKSTIPRVHLRDSFD